MKRLIPVLALFVVCAGAVVRYASADPVCGTGSVSTVPQCIYTDLGPCSGNANEYGLYLPKEQRGGTFPATICVPANVAGGGPWAYSPVCNGGNGGFTNCASALRPILVFPFVEEIEDTCYMKAKCEQSVNETVCKLVLPWQPVSKTRLINFCCTWAIIEPNPTTP